MAYNPEKVDLLLVDDDADFYVLFRVEKIERGDNCTITWKRIAPPDEAAQNK